MGGKARLAHTVLRRMPEHKTYVEAFAGGAAVLFMREAPAPVEVLNDIDSELVSFFRVVKHHMVEFCNQFRWALVSRQLFQWLDETPPDTLTDIQRAARFYYLQKLCFGARPDSRSFGVDPGSRPRLNLVRLEEDISAAHERLARVVIEHLGYAECIQRYDREQTFFFLDPLYWKLAGYGHPFGLDDYERLAELMRGMRGKAMLTINDHPDIRRVFKGLKRDRVAIKYTVGKVAPKTSAELVYRNW
jgi:DNA adenine methylase